MKCLNAWINARMDEYRDDIMELLATNFGDHKFALAGYAIEDSSTL